MDPKIATLYRFLQRENPVAGASVNLSTARAAIAAINKGYRVQLYRDDHVTTVVPVQGIKHGQGPSCLHRFSDRQRCYRLAAVLASVGRFGIDVYAPPKAPPVQSKPRRRDWRGGPSEN